MQFKPNAVHHRCLKHHMDNVEHKLRDLKFITQEIFLDIFFCELGLGDHDDFWMAWMRMHKSIKLLDKAHWLGVDLDDLNDIPSFKSVETGKDHSFTNSFKNKMEDFQNFQGPPCSPRFAIGFTFIYFSGHKTAGLYNVWIQIYRL